MPIVVEVVSKEDFATWLAAQKNGGAAPAAPAETAPAEAAPATDEASASTEQSS